MAAIISLEKSMDKSFYKTLNEIKSECKSDVIVKEINDYILMKEKVHDTLKDSRYIIPFSDD